MNIISFIIGAIVSGIIQIFLAVSFEHTYRRYYRKFRRVLYAIINIFRGTNLPLSSERYKIGQYETNIMVLEGTPTEPYAHDRIICHLEESPVEYPPEVQRLYKRVKEEQKNIKKKKGRTEFHKGAMVSFVNYHHAYTNVLEEPSLFLDFKTSDYYAFLATALKLDDPFPKKSSPYETLRSKYLKHDAYRSPVPFLATSFGVNLATVTNDDHLIIGKRSESGVSHYHGLFDVPVMESVNPEKDKDSLGQHDIYATAKRGLKEELGIEVKDNSQIKIFTLDVDVKYYSFGLTGFIHTYDYSREDIMGLRSQGVRDSWENSDLDFVHFNPHSVAQYIKKKGGVLVFHPASFVAIVQSLIYEYGERTVNQEFR